MKKGIFVFLMIVFLSACAEKEAMVYPSDLMERETFVMVMSELYIIESIYNHKISTDQAKHEDMDAFYKEVFDRFEITYSDYEKALTWHKEHPEELSKVYDEVIEELDRRRDAI